MVCGNLKDLNRTTVTDNTFHYKAFNIAKNAKYVEYWCGFASMVFQFFDKKPLHF